MKFGQNLSRNQVPEWTPFYINYTGLKKLIKSASEATKTKKVVDLGEFFHLLDRNLENVDIFYNKKFSESSRRLKLLQERYGRSTNIVTDMDRHDVEELAEALLELRGQLRKLQVFGEVNRRGFLKIMKKVDKKVPRSLSQQRYTEDKVDSKPFAANTALSEAMPKINSWLSVLGDAQDQDDTKSMRPVQPSKGVSFGSIPNLPVSLLDIIEKAIENDDVRILEKTLIETNLDDNDPAFQKLQLKLLQRSISSKSKDCIDYLLRNLKSLDDVDDVSQRNCLHRLAISIGRSRLKSALLEDQETDPTVLTPTDYIVLADHPKPISKEFHSPEVESLGMDDEFVPILSYVLDHMQPGQRDAIKARDVYGRLPLHYGAQSGTVVVCQLLMGHMRKWGQFNTEYGIDAPARQDDENLAPLHLGVIGGHPLTTRTLLEAENWQGGNNTRSTMTRCRLQSSALLTLATRSNFVVIVRLLVDAGIDINWQDDQGVTAMHVAARFGHLDCAKILLEGSEDQKADVELVEKAFSWTPLHVASVDGQLQIVELLVAAGAEVDKVDASGWTAREHAALRGHMDIARFLSTVAIKVKHVPEISSSGSEVSVSTPTSSPPPLAIKEQRSQNNEGHFLSQGIKPIKTFGHRHLTNESLVLVSLGSMDMRKNVEAVKLDRISMADVHSMHLDTALSLVVSAIGARGEQSVIDLPVQENISTEPIAFTALGTTQMQLIFDIVPTYGGREHKVGRGVALLGSVKPTVGVKRMNLQGDLSVPIMAATTLEVIGCINFSFLVITPFSHPNMEIVEKQTHWKSMTSTMVIGHRGLGKNIHSNKTLQIGENTIPSFIAAAKLGANYVEFDVQLTKDHIPVIYHDFLVSETGIDAPVHTLTLEQFLHINNRHTSHSLRTPSPESINYAVSENERKTEDVCRPRSHSMGDLDAEADMEDRMKHTRDFKEQGFKANTRGKFIQAPFTTLEELFKKIPEEVGYNIEMKYPMLFESEEQEMDTYAVELNSFCDSVLQKVYDLRKKRNVVFSSFHPDICLLLSFKQPSIPIMFLTDAGISLVGDIRTSSLQEAIRFASKWNLLGIVSAAELFCNSPRLVRVVKESGLVCMSYGTLNNDPVKVHQQVKEGIDAVIVDNVLAIRKSLQQKKSKEANTYRSAASAETAATTATTLISNTAIGSIETLW